MNVVYLHQYFNTPEQPGGTRSYEMARRLAAWGHTVHMVTSIRRPAGGQSGWQERMLAGIHVHTVPVPYDNAMPYHQRIAAFFCFAFHAARRAVQLGPDVVFATSTPLTIALPAVYASRRRRVPMVFEVRDLWPEMPIAVGALKGGLAIWAARRLERFAYHNATRVIALSPGMKEGVVAAGYPAERVHVIPNACDVELFDVAPSLGAAFRRRLSWLQRRPLVAYVGTLGRVNGVDYLVEVAARCLRLDPEVRFLIVGDGKDRPQVEELARERAVLGVNLFIMDPVPKQNVPEILSATNLAVSTFVDLPPMWKNSANKFFDALASGTPVAINYQGWQADLLRATGAGLVLPSHDYAAAAQAIVALLHDKRRLESATAAASELARTRFDRDLLFEEFERVLLDAVAGARP